MDFPSQKILKLRSDVYLRLEGESPLLWDPTDVHIHCPISSTYEVSKIKCANDFSGDMVVCICKVTGGHSRDKQVRLHALASHILAEEQQCSFEELGQNPGQSGQPQMRHRLIPITEKL